MAERQKLNFDHPASIEFELLVNHVKQLIEGKPIEMPIYSYITCTRAKETITVAPCDVIIVEGILILTDEHLRQLLQIKVFVDAPRRPINTHY